MFIGLGSLALFVIVGVEIAMTIKDVRLLPFDGVRVAWLVAQWGMMGLVVGFWKLMLL